MSYSLNMETDIQTRIRFAWKPPLLHLARPLLVLFALNSSGFKASPFHSFVHTIPSPS